jgi:threonine aldolase
LLVTGSLARKVKIHQIGPISIRCVTHKDVDAEDVGRALEAFREITAAW